MRLDRAHHRLIAGDSVLAEAVKVLARSHQSLVWSRQRQVNMLRSMLGEFYPAALQAFAEEEDGLLSPAAADVLAIAPTPAQGRRLSIARLEKVLRTAGRQRSVTVMAQRLHAALQSPRLAAREGVDTAYGASVSALVAVIAELTRQVQALAEQVSAHFGQPPDAEVYSSQPGLGPVLAARVLADFGDDAEPYADVK